MQLIHSINTPTISIGVPVYNGEETLTAALDSLLAQSFTDFEIIISDNASTDKTEDICLSFCKRDSRIIYIRQEKNIGAAKNFEFVLNESRGRYFMWAAADDLRSSNFLNENICFLEKNNGYIASTSPNCFENLQHTKPINFSLDGSLEHRISVFFDNCWKSHGVFYSVIRRKTLAEYKHHGEYFFAADWSLIMYLISKGKINRTENELITFGVNGISSSKDAWRTFRTHIVCWALPFYKFSLHTLNLKLNVTKRYKLLLLLKLIKLNFNAMKDQIISELYIFYVHHIKTHRKKKTENRLTL